MFLQRTLPISRIIQVFILQLGIGIIFLIIAFLVLNRDRKRLNFILSGFFIFVFLGVLFNVIYALIEDVFLATILSHITVFFLFGATIFPVIFNLILLKSEKVITTKIQLAIISIYFVLLILVSLIPGAITITIANDYVPFWSLEFFIVLSLLFIVYTAIPSIYTSIKIYQRFEDPLLKKKWRYYMVTIPFYFLNAVMVGLCNYYNDPDLRLIWNALALSLFVVGYLIYYGVGKQLEK